MTAGVNDGSCDYCSCSGDTTDVNPSPYRLVVEGSPSILPGLTVYRFYVQLESESDRMSAIFGNDEVALQVSTPQGAFNTPLNSGWNASGLNPAFTSTFPELLDDSFATIGLDGPASSGAFGSEDPLLIEGTPAVINDYFTNDGADGFTVNSFVGASWFVLGSAVNGLGDADLRVLVMQVTTAGSISGQLNYQVFPSGNGFNEKRVSVAFDGAGTFGGFSGGNGTDNACGCTDSTATNFDPAAEYDDGSCEYLSGCTDPLACNFNPEAVDDDGSCEELDECGICGGPGAIFECGCDDVELDARLRQQRA